MSETGIHITKVTGPEDGVGWPISTYCPKCKKTTIFIHSWSVKPENGKVIVVPLPLCGDYKHLFEIGWKPFYTKYFS